MFNHNWPAAVTSAVLVPVGAGSWFNHDRRTARTIIDDQAITVKTNLAIAKNKPMSGRQAILAL